MSGSPRGKGVARFAGPSLWLFGATAVGNLCNFLYHLYMVRRLAPDQYAMLTALIGLMAVLAVPAATVQTTTSHRMAHLSAQASWHALRANLLRRLAIGGLVVVASFLLIAVIYPELMAFLRFPAIPAIGLGWGGAVALAFLIPIVWGALQGLQAFGHFGVNLFASSALKLAFGILFIRVGWGVTGASLGLLAASVVTVCLAMGQLRAVLRARRPQLNETPSSWRARAATWINDGFNECRMVLTKPQGVSRYTLTVALSVMAYTSLTNSDIVLVKHYFEPSAAGHYAVGAMVSRMVLFLPMAFSMVLFPKVVQAAAAGQDTRPLLRKVMGLTALVSGAAGLACVAAPQFFMRVLAGAIYPEAIVIVRVLAVAMAGMAIANLALVYLLAIQAVRRTLPFLVAAVAHILLIGVWHVQIQDVAWATLAVIAGLTMYAVALAIG